MSADKETVEQEIQRKGLLAPRVTPERIQEVQVQREYAVFAGSTLTVCVITLRNGFTVVGKSACASLENFNKDLGERIARADAERQIWALEGYALRERLYQQAQDAQAQV